jgi:hypothetical protein
MFCARMTSRICGQHVDMSGDCIHERGGEKGTDALLEGEQVTLGESIGFGNNRDEIHTGTKTLHDLNVEGLETKTGSVKLKSNMTEAYV